MNQTPFAGLQNNKICDWGEKCCPHGFFDFPPPSTCNFRALYPILFRLELPWAAGNFDIQSSDPSATTNIIYQGNMKHHVLVYNWLAYSRPHTLAHLGAPYVPIWLCGQK